MLTRRTLLAAGTVWVSPPAPTLQREAEAVFLHAWAGDGAVNAFIAWLNERMIMRHGIRVRHVRLPDLASALLLTRRGAADEPLDAVMTHHAPKWVAPGSRVLPLQIGCGFGTVVIPAQAPHRAGALLLGQFLLSSEAQGRATDPLLMASG